MDDFTLNTDASFTMESIGQHGMSFTDQGCEAQIETWDEGMSRLLADLEGRVGVEQERGGEREVWNPDRWMWETIAV